MNTINNNVYRDISPQEDRMIIKYDNRNLKEKVHGQMKTITSELKRETKWQLKE
jgi:hypothetical protein